MSEIKTTHDDVSFLVYHPDFQALLGSNPSSHLMQESAEKVALYHEACIYHQPSHSVFVTSNQIPSKTAGPDTAHKEVKLSRVYDVPGGRTDAEFVTYEGIEGSMLNGGVNFGPDSMLLCAQGSLNDRDLAGLISVPIMTDANPSPKAELVVSSVYGTPFNSVNDVIVDPQDSSIWFTDPHYGHHQEIRPKPQLPNQVYRFDPKTKAVRAIADGFTRCNGLCFSPDFKKLYVTDTGAIHGSKTVPTDLAGPSHVYCFDIVRYDQSAEPFLVNRRLFAYAPGRIPDGIKCDTAGNVYSGCGDGIEVWNPHGVQIGTIAIKGGCANFCFGEKGAIYACNETRFWKIQLNGEGVLGALLGI